MARKTVTKKQLLAAYRETMTHPRHLGHVGEGEPIGLLLYVHGFEHYDSRPGAREILAWAEKMSGKSLQGLCVYWRNHFHRYPLQTFDCLWMFFKKNGWTKPSGKKAGA